MSRFPRLQASLLLFLVWESACHRKQVTVPVPPPPAETQPIVPEQPAPSTTPETPSTGVTTHPQEPTPYQVNKPAPPPPPAKKPSRSATVPTPQPAPAPPPPAAPVPAAPPPKLGDILKPDEQKQYNAAIDQSLSHAQSSLNSVSGRQLDKDQQAEVEHIRNFMQQAQTTRGSDPAGAKSLAERAEVLARDLAASFH
jgi:hypothetical protein